jgi:hypothetical protein
MPFRIVRSAAAEAAFAEQERTNPVKAAKIRKTLGMLSVDPKHPGLNSHTRKIEKGPNGEEIRESFEENHAPRAWRVYWMYGPGPDLITVLAIVPHDD